MPIYKNTKNGPSTVDTADGNAMSVRGKGEFYVDRATELSVRFKAKKTKKSVRFVRADPRDDPKPRLMIEEAVAVPPEPVPEVVPAPLPETAPNASPSDAPGHVSTVDESSTSVAPVDAQLPDNSGSSDTDVSGAAEPQPGKGAATSDDEWKPKKRRKSSRKKASSSSKD